ncbi:immunoglobulin alpha Fc receptor [Camelus dromedarius]|uniref:immunoglobulin alpha Fc receptor n=1 Tax=Camelus dromedarius TaxID=9838 RepID=UPI00311A2C6F
MAPRDTALFCLVLYLGQKIQAQDGDLPIPTVSATPGFLVPRNESVKILCCGTPESYLYQLELLGNATYKVVERKLGFQKEAEFTINHVGVNSAGRYRCQYRKQHRWSEHSEALELVVTGLYDKPFLTTNQSLVVMPGEKISLWCSSAHIPFDRFSLSKEGGATLSQHQNAGHQGDFILGPADSSFSGNYTCYGWKSGSPYVWSAPSDALQLVVTDTRNHDYMTENLVRMGVAGLVLAALLAVLAEHWRSHQVPHNKQKCQAE